MKQLRKWFLNYVVSDRRSPAKNRERVGQNLMILTILIFFVFIINFAIIIGTDSKFGVDLSEGAKQVHQAERVVQAKRGTIYDRNGIPIAEDSTTYSVVAIIDKNYISATKEKLYIQKKQFETVAAVFQEFLSIEEDYTISQLSQEDKSQVAFGAKGNNISYSTMKAMRERFEEEKITGIDFTSSPDRMYPQGTFASHLIGLAQPQENKDFSKSLVGTTGLEASFNSILAGQDGLVTYQKDRNGIIQLGTAQVERKAVDGSDVYTTLSAPIQVSLETLMDKFQETAQGTFASATLVNAKTGEILATTQRPTFNADTKAGLESEDFSWDTILYQGYYEPGSTMKVMTLAAAIDAGVFNPNEGYVNDQLIVADATIRDWDVNMGISGGRYLTMANALPFSSNIGMAMLQQKIGTEKWLKVLADFKIGLPTRFGLNTESAGIFPAENIVTYAMSAFGHGVSVTQVQMLRLFSVIANDGVMLQPHFISQIYDPNTNTNRVVQPEVLGKPVSTKAAKMTRDYMVAVGTDPYYGTMYVQGVGPVVQVGDYSVAVKSGTAQIAGENGVGYLEGENDLLYSVVAMIPAEDPQFILYTTLQQPEEKWTGILWQQLINPLLEEAMFLKDSLGQPVATEKATSYKLGDIVGASPGDTAAELRRHLIQPILLGTGNKISQVSRKEGDNLAPNSQLLILTNRFDSLPDMYGWTQETVETFAEWQGIEVTFKGSGRVTKQSKVSGTALSDVKTLTITLSKE